MEPFNEQPTEQDAQTVSQIFDASLKELVEEEAQMMLPELVAGVRYKQTLNVELVRPTLRADKAYLVCYGEAGDHILHVEFESGISKRVPARMLAYGSILHLDHELPVISVAVHLFKTPVLQPPLIISSGGRTLVWYDYLVISLYELDAQQYVREHKTWMYPLLPTMQHVTTSLMEQVLQELVVQYKEDGIALSRRYVWLQLLLNRTETITMLEKQSIQEVMDMYSRFWEDDPHIKKTRAESEARGKALGEIEGEARGEARGEIKGEMRTLQKMIFTVIQTRFPDLMEMAQQTVPRIHDLNVLNAVAEQIVATDDAVTVRRLLCPPAD